MSHRILTVDDGPTATQELRRLIERAGYEVEEENDAMQALEKARSFQPHVVILDYLMPNAHGGDAAWQLASDPSLRSVKIILCSGREPEEFIHKLPPARIPIVEKPVEVKKLLSLIQTTVAETHGAGNS
jgi:two-component system alkaline phosphatase synthesis response regulator PhoP